MKTKIETVNGKKQFIYSKTHIAIAFKSKDGKFLASYCYFDGYPERAWGLFTSYYNTKKKMLKLINLGSIMVLESTIAESKFYIRDLGESFKDHKPKKFNSIEGLFNFYKFVDYVHIVDEVAHEVTMYRQDHDYNLFLKYERTYGY